MLDYKQMFNLSRTVDNCLRDICCSQKIITGGKETFIAIHKPEEIAVIGKMLCEALNGMQDEVKFHAMRLPTKTEGEGLLGMVNKIVFEDAAPEDEFIKGAQKRVCPRCGNEEIESDHQFCKICGLKL